MAAQSSSQKQRTLFVDVGSNGVQEVLPKKEVEEYAIMTPVVKEEETGGVKRELEEEPAAAAAPHPKRAAGEPVRCYRDVDLSTWVTRVRNKNAHGSPNVTIFSDVGPRPEVALSHRDDECCTFPFKLDLEPGNGAQPPAFLSGAESTRMTEGLDLQIVLTPEQAAFVAQVDEWAKGQALLNCREWWNKNFSAAEIAAAYTPLLRQDPENKYAPKMKAKFVLSSTQPNLLTQVFYNRKDSYGRTEKLQGAGWAFVKPLLGVSFWKGNSVRAVVSFTRFWVVGKKFGVSAEYKHLVVTEKQMPRVCLDFPELDD